MYENVKIGLITAFTVMFVHSISEAFLSPSLSPSLPVSSDVSVPVRGKDSIGNIYQGQSTYLASGKGDFWVENINGLRCEGEYNSLDQSATIKVDATCSDGRTGFAILSRALSSNQGIAIAKFSDGITAQFAFGESAVWANIPIQ